MAQKVRRQLVNLFYISFSLAVFGLYLTPSRAQTNFGQVLVSFSFEDSQLRSDGKAFSLFESGRGSVQSSTRYHYSGYRSLEVKDVPGDGQFPELQGYFPLRESGKIYLRFNLLTPTPDESLNIALAGPAGFALKKDGIGFWLSSKKSWLYHTTDSIPTKLFQLQSLVWYSFKIVYDLERGVYDLSVTEEGKSLPIIDLKNQWNASHQIASKLDKFSFIGDLGTDDSAVVYYVDDVLVATEPNFGSLATRSQVRKSLSFDGWHELKRNSSEKALCPHILEPRDLGIETSNYAVLKSHGLIEPLEKILAGNGQEIPDRGLDPRLRDLVGGINAWSRACLALKSGDFSSAEKSFRLAKSLQPMVKMHPLGLAIALAAQSRWADVNEIIQEVYLQWQDDPRFDLALAIMGLMRKDLRVSAQVLAKFSPQLVRDLNDPLIQRVWQGVADRSTLNEIKIKYPSKWKEIISAPQLAESYFYVLLWQGKFADAFAFADGLYVQLRKVGGHAGVWGLLSGDALVFGDKLEPAIERYSQALVESDSRLQKLLWSRLADVYAKTGDLKKEQRARKKI